MISVDSVSFSYNNYKPIVKILNKVSFDVGNGEFVCLLGPSGCGKSTLMKMIERSIYPQSGSVHVNFKYNDDLDLTLYDYRRKIGYVGQSGNLLPHMTILQNFRLQAKLRDIDFNMMPVDELKFLFKVSHFDQSLINKYPRELSGGQAQRASIFKALIGLPEILLLDEPLSALDPKTRDNLQIELGELHHKLPNMSVLMITHDVQEAIILSDKIVVLKDGNIIFNGNPTEIMTTKDDTIKSFLGIGKVEIPSIYWNSWRVAAIEKMHKYNADEIFILDDNGNRIGNIDFPQVYYSINKVPANELLFLDEIMKTDLTEDELPSHDWRIKHNIPRSRAVKSYIKSISLEVYNVK